MAETTTISVRIPVETKRKLDRLAELTTRSRSYLAAEALELYVGYELEIVEGIAEGIADADAGRVYTSDEMRAHLTRIVDRTKSKKSKRAA